MPDSTFAPTSPAVVEDPGDAIECDLAIVGAGVGGATMAWALRDSGARILVLEKGDFLPRERENWSPRAVHMQGRYKNSEPWLDADGRPFVPGTYHYVGGCSKFFGAVMARMREHDFEEFELREGTSPGWPISYADIEPYYQQAEELYGVHGGDGDPTEPWRSGPFPYPPVPHEPQIEALADRLRGQGMQPFALPLAIDWRPGGKCVRCATCDSFPCLVAAKGDAETRALRPALQSGSVKLLTRADVREVVLGASGESVAELRVRRDGKEVRVRAAKFVLAAGAVNSAALLLRSRGRWAQGVANSSGMVGRNYMAHVTSFLVAVQPWRRGQPIFQKTLSLNDWYGAAGDRDYPLGNVQGLGKLIGPMVKPARRWVPLGLLDWFTRHSVDLFAQSEDAPLVENRVVVDDAGRIHLRIERPTNLGPHRELVSRMVSALRRSGYPLVFTQRLGVEATGHQCGTARMGEDPTDSVVDGDCGAHDLSNLWIADTSVFPSSAAVNTALTAAANSLRIADSGQLVA